MRCANEENFFGSSQRNRVTETMKDSDGKNFYFTIKPYMRASVIDLL